MILQVDMGNTRLKWRLRYLSATVACGSQNNEEGYSGLEKSFKEYSIENVWIVSVVSAQEEGVFSLWLRNILGLNARFIRSNLTFGKVQNGYAAPLQLGADRWVGIVGAYYHIQQSFVLVDIGSAITVDVVTADGRHLGGYIAPGIAMVRRTLMRETRQVNLNEREFTVTGKFGCDTDAAVGSAQAVMVASLVRHAYEQLLDFNLGGGDPKILITGGDALWLQKNFPDALVLPDLVLDGLELIASSV